MSEAITPAERLMEIRVKLHSAELAQGLEERAQRKQPSARRAHHVGQLDLRGRVDFTHAMRGEVTVTAPFNQTIRLDARVRTVPAKAPEIEHPILKAQRWQRLLETGAIPTRMALAKKEGLTPGAITQIMQLLDLSPDIQRILASMKTSSEVWHFGYRPMGELARLPFAEQRAKLSVMLREYHAKRMRLVPKSGPSMFSGGESSPRTAQRIRIG